MTYIIFHMSSSQSCVSWQNSYFDVGGGDEKEDPLGAVLSSGFFPYFPDGRSGVTGMKVLFIVI